MKYLKQILYEMRHQRMMTWVSIGGTALSIFLVMAYFMSERINSVEVAPVSERGRMLYGTGIHLRSTDPNANNEGSAGLSRQAADEIYSGLEGIETMSKMLWFPDTYNIGAPNEEAIAAPAQMTDENYWKVFDFTFLYGHPFDKASVDAGEKILVLTRSLARRIFKAEDVVGREVQVNYISYRVVGVVDDVPPMFQGANADMIMPMKDSNFSWNSEGPMSACGQLQVVMLMKPGVTRDDIARQVKARYATMTERLKDESVETVYHEQPYTAETVASTDFGSNSSPDTSQADITRWFVYSILLLLPAINLSSMTRSRLRHRVSEIGVRRAFGASKWSIVRQMLSENLIITVIGGFIGLVASFLFMWLVSDFFFDFGGNVFTEMPTVAKPTFEMLFSWQAFVVALIFCFALNLVSAFVPSWSASRVNPAVAISKVRS